ncbi:MAG: type 4a pilus biogenesis protein PilO, partial [Actinomycetota bacterium]|nr:type 4a pilus biogenesis protein PilO [Actinomycetota bacterium]
MKLNSTQKLIAVIVGAVILAALAVFLIIVPQLSAMGRLDTQIDQSEQDVAAARTLLSQRQQIKLNSSQTETQLLRLANELPESPQLPEFIIELQDTINESGLEFSTLEPTEPVANQGYKA